MRGLDCKAPAGADDVLTLGALDRHDLDEFDHELEVNGRNRPGRDDDVTLCGERARRGARLARAGARTRSGKFLHTGRAVALALAGDAFDQVIEVCLVAALRVLAQAL